MKKLILTALALFSFSITPPIKGEALNDFAAGLFFGSAPIFGHIWLYKALRSMKQDVPQKAAVAVPSSLVGTYVWYKAAEYLRKHSQLGAISYVIPALPVLLVGACIRAADAIQSGRANPKR